MSYAAAVYDLNVEALRTLEAVVDIGDSFATLSTNAVELGAARRADCAALAVSLMVHASRQFGVPPAHTRCLRLLESAVDLLPTEPRCVWNCAVLHYWQRDWSTALALCGLLSGVLPNLELPALRMLALSDSSSAFDVLRVCEAPFSRVVFAAVAGSAAVAGNQWALAVRYLEAFEPSACFLLVFCVALSPLLTCLPCSERLARLGVCS
jgi:hypothetical protein